MHKISKLLNRNIVIAGLLLIMVLVFALPVFRNGVYRGHDLPFHLGRIKMLASELKQGHFPVRYEQAAWHGYGYISSTMYPNLFMSIPAVLYIIGVPLIRAYNIYVLLVNIATVLVSYYSFTRIFKSKQYGLVSTLLYNYAGYRFVNAYLRAAVGEYTAMVFLPLLAYGLYRLYYEQEEYSFFGRVYLLIISVTGIIQSHVLSTEMIALTVIIFALINIKKSIEVIKEILVSVLFATMINIFFLLPFLQTYLNEKMNINGERINEGISGFGMHIEDLLRPFAGQINIGTLPKDWILSLGFNMWMCLVLTCVVLINSKKLLKNNKDDIAFKAIKVTFILGILALYVSTIYFPWKLFEGSNMISNIMSSIQYPWRYLAVQILCFTITGVYSLKVLIENADIVKKGISRFVLALLMAVFCFSALYQAAVFFRTISYKLETVVSESYITDWPKDFDSLYLLQGTDRQEIFSSLTPEVDGDRVLLPVFDYKNVVVTDSGSVIEHTRGDNNRIEISIKDFSDSIEIKYIEPQLWRVCEVISLFFILGFIGWGVTNHLKA